MKNDRVEVVVDAGGLYGSARVYEIAATRAGRRVEITSGRGMVEVTEVTRGGTPVRTARFLANRVLALVEHPADEGSALPEERPLPLDRAEAKSDGERVQTAAKPAAANDAEQPELYPAN